MRITRYFGLLAALLATPVSACARLLAPAGIDANNTDGEHFGPLSRIAEAAITGPGLLLTPGTNPATQVIICTATTEPCGTAYDTTPLNGRVGVIRLTQGATKTFIASKAFAAGVRLYTTAGGQVTDVAVNNSWLVGKSLVASGGAGEPVEAESCFPVKQTV